MSDIGLLVPIIGVTCGLVAIVGRTIVRPWLRLKERQLEMQASMTAEKAAQYAAHTERLEDRVRVLERIATDRGVDLADEIEQLRDKPLN
ncbi:hypothetical protein BH10PSE12_BH10PSE12_11620 [soil metagenome]